MLAPGLSRVRPPEAARLVDTEAFVSDRLLWMYAHQMFFNDQLPNEDLDILRAEHFTWRRRPDFATCANYSPRIH